MLTQILKNGFNIYIEEERQANDPLYKMMEEGYRFLCLNSKFYCLHQEIFNKNGRPKDLRNRVIKDYLSKNNIVVNVYYNQDYRSLSIDSQRGYQIFGFLYIPKALARLQNGVNKISKKILENEIAKMNFFIKNEWNDFMKKILYWLILYKNSDNPWNKEFIFNYNDVLNFLSKFDVTDEDIRAS